MNVRGNFYYDNILLTNMVYFYDNILLTNMVYFYDNIYNKIYYKYIILKAIFLPVQKFVENYAKYLVVKYHF